MRGGLFGLGDARVGTERGCTVIVPVRARHRAKHWRISRLVDDSPVGSQESLQHSLAAFPPRRDSRQVAFYTPMFR